MTETEKEMVEIYRTEVRELKKQNAELLEALKEAVDHLEYCGYGDEWEKTCAYESKLPERLSAILLKYESR